MRGAAVVAQGEQIGGLIQDVSPLREVGAAGSAADEIVARVGEAPSDIGRTVAVKVARERGRVSDLDLSSVKAAGYDDAQVIEIVQHVALNVLTNYINLVGQTDLDFPEVQARKAA